MKRFESFGEESKSLMLELCHVSDWSGENLLEVLVRVNQVPEERRRIIEAMLMESPGLIQPFWNDGADLPGSDS
jgi:hypothetical protein